MALVAGMKVLGQGTNVTQFNLLEEHNQMVLSLEDKYIQLNDAVPYTASLTKGSVFQVCRAASLNALSRGFDSCWWLPQGMAL